MKLIIRQSIQHQKNNCKEIIHIENNDIIDSIQ